MPHIYRFVLSFAIVAFALAAPLLARGSSDSQPITFSPVSETSVNTRHKLHADAKVSKAPSNIVEQIRSHDEEVVIEVPTAHGPWLLKGRLFEVLEADAQVLSRDERGDHVMPTPQHAFVQGVVVGIPNSRFFFAAFDTHVSAIIEFKEPGGIQRFMVSPDTIIDGRMATTIVHEVIEIPGTPDRCHAEELDGYQRRSDSVMTWLNTLNVIEKSSDEEHGAGEFALQLALECDFLFFQRHANNLGYAAQYALTLAAASSAIFQRDAGVQVRVPFLRVWTIEDNYGSAIGDRLGNIRTRWNVEMPHVKRSVTCMMSGGGGGGLAWVGVLCDGFGYNVSGVGGNVNFPSTNYLWDIDVTCHELGHNIGSSHTHNCSWNPPIDSCWVAEGGCYDAVLPQRGSIMSYCHLQWQGTELEFHPRIATLFRAVTETRDCFGPVSNVHDTDLAVIDIIEPYTGSTVTNGENFAQRVVIKNSGTASIAGASLELRLARFPNETLSTRTVNLGRIPAGSLDTIRFPELLIDEVGQYLFEATISDGGDKLTTNNQVTRQFQVGDAPTATIVVVSPNGGEVYETGDSVMIEYSSTGVSRFKTEVSFNNGETWQVVRNRTVASSGPIVWVVPPVPVSADTNGAGNPSCWIRIVSEDDTRVNDASDGPFSIIMSSDIQAYDVIYPNENSTEPTSLSPRVIVRNNGLQATRDVDVLLSLRWVRHDQPSYDHVITVPNIDPLESITLEFPETGLLADGVHIVDFRVISENDQNPANNRYWRAFTAVGLTPPQSVRAEYGPNRVIVGWQTTSAQDGDITELWRGQNGASMELLQSFAPTVQAWLDETVSDGVEYAYALRTVRDNQTSVFSDMNVATPETFPHGFDLRAPQAIGPEHSSTNVPLPADLVWESVPGADRYEVQVAADQNFTELIHVFITHNDGALPAPAGFGELVWWRVRAINESTNGPWGRPVSFSATESCAGNAVYFNGEEARATNNDIVWTGGPITVEFWQYVLRADRKNSTTFSFGPNDDVNNRLQAHVPWGDGRIYWDYGSTGDSGRIAAPYGSAFDRWAHIALVSDGTSFMKIYIDGQEVASKTGAMEAKNLTGIGIGAMNERLWLKGAVDEFRIWQSARTAQQIRENMGRSEPADKKGLFAFWRFSDGAGTRVLDESGWGRQLTLTANTEWLESGAYVNCEVAGVLNAPVLTTAGTTPSATRHSYTLGWNEVQGAQWYEFELYIGERVSGRWLNQAKNLVQPSITIGGLPPETMCTWRVRARSTTDISDWSSGPFLTPSACESNVAFLPANGSHFVNEEFLFNGRSTTVEYWARVADADVGDRSSFIIGQTDPAEERFQAHAPWRDKQLFFDYGDRQRGGRINTGIDNTIDRWAHIAVASNGIDDMRIYVDGQQQYQSSFARNPGKKQRIAIGSNDISSHHFKGYLSDLRVWNVLKSEEQIRESMYERVVGSKSHLVGSWPMDDGSGLVAEDVTAALNDAVASAEPGWESDTTGLLMNVPPALRGPVTVTKGDTVAYSLHADLATTISWRARNGIIIDKTDQRNVTIQWVDNSTQGEICVTRMFPSGCVDSACYSINLREPVSVNEDLSIEDLHVSPNPATESVVVTVPMSMPFSTYTIVSSIGSVVGQGAFAGVENHIDVSMLSSGTYRFVIATATGVRTLPLVIQK